MTVAPEYPQRTLFPPSAVELTIRIGAVGSVDHVQTMYEIRNATDGQLLAMWSAPHARLAHLEAAVALVVNKAVANLSTYVVPF